MNLITHCECWTKNKAVQDSVHTKLVLSRTCCWSTMQVRSNVGSLLNRSQASVTASFKTQFSCKVKQVSFGRNDCEKVACILFNPHYNLACLPTRAFPLSCCSPEGPITTYCTYILHSKKLSSCTTSSKKYFTVTVNMLALMSLQATAACLSD